MTPYLIAHWPLDSDARDAVGRFHGEARDVRFTGAEARFNGSSSRIVVPDRPALRVGPADFTLTLRVKPDRPLAGAPGALVTKFDPAARGGFTFHLSSESPGYSGLGDSCHVQFGVDDGYAGAWEDCGKPAPGNPLITALTPHEGALYAGIATAAEPADAAHVFRWNGGSAWTDCGRLGTDPDCLSVMSLLAHDGRLYAGTGCWDWERAAGQWPGFKPAATRVFLYEGGTRWRDLGRIGDSARVLSLAGFQGALYAGLDRLGGGHIFRWQAGRWTDCGTLDGDNVECLTAHQGVLYAASHSRIFTYAGGGAWKLVGHKPFGINQIHSTAVYGDRLHIGTWPQGYVLRLEPSGEWVNTGRLGLPPDPTAADCNEVNDLAVHNGKLYAGVIPKAQVYRYESDGHWTLLGRLGSRPDWTPFDYNTWCRVTALASFGGRLLAGTGSCIGRAGDGGAESSLGRVYALQTGAVAAHHQDIGGGWTRLAARRRGGELTLFVNGQAVAAAELPPRQAFDLSNVQPLLIGAGPESAFAGALADVRLYGGALPDVELA